MLTFISPILQVSSDLSRAILADPSNLFEVITSVGPQGMRQASQHQHRGTPRPIVGVMEGRPVGRSAVLPSFGVATSSGAAIPCTLEQVTQHDMVDSLKPEVLLDEGVEIGVEEIAQLIATELSGYRALARHGELQPHERITKFAPG